MTASVRLICCVFAITAMSPSAGAIDGLALKSAMNSLESANIDTGRVYSVNNVTITCYDLAITLDSGKIGFFEPILLNSVPRTFAAYFKGAYHFKYRPTPPIERSQISRFFHRDSLSEPCRQLILLFGDSARRQLESLLPGQRLLCDRQFSGDAADRYEHSVRLSDRSFAYGLLMSLIGQSEETYMFAYVDPNSGTDLLYCFDPARREEIGFFKRYWTPGVNFFEKICSYAAGAVDITTTLNGKSKELIKTRSYIINSTIRENGDYSGAAQMTFDVLKSASSVDLVIRELLTVDSVTDSAGAVPFSRFKDEKYWYLKLYVYFDHPLAVGTTHTVTIWSHGDISKRIQGEFYVAAGAYWYPHYGYGQPARFELLFRTPKQYEFVSTGDCDHRKLVGDTLESHWIVTEPADNVSFSIGNIKKYEFSDTLAGSVDVYYSEALHRDMARELAQEGELTGSHMEKQVSGDVINALRLFSHQFGKYAYGRMSVSEILLSHGEAFPGFIHMGWPTWKKTDAWGYERMFRAHEVAHQWWGVGVGYETYHDQWMSEGFAEYSALMYLQAVKGNDAFMDRMKEYRKDVVSVREKPTDSSSETGPIIMGYRTSSTKADGDMDLIVYKKGALVLHMLRNLLIDWRTFIEDKFFEMMKEWYATHKGRAATTEDFIKITEKYTGEDMTWFFDQWVYGTEIPTYKFEYDIQPGTNNTFVVNGKVTTQGTSDNFKMYVPLEIQIDNTRKAYVRLKIEGPESVFNLPGLPVKPKALKLNPFESVLAEVKQ